MSSWRHASSNPSSRCARFIEDPAATLDDLREAVTMLEDAERISRRVFGGAHPTTSGIEQRLRNAQAVLRTRDGAPTYDEPD